MPSLKVSKERERLSLKSVFVNIEIGKTTVIDRRVRKQQATSFGIAASSVNLSVLAIYHCFRRFL